MPSYYDSSKKKPGKAEVKYAKGGKTTLREKARRIFLPTREENLAGHERRREEQQGRADALEQSRIEQRDRGVARNERLQKEAQDRYDKRREAAKARAEALEKRRGSVKKSGGGQLKVTGMGAATRGGNFTRNG
tara:strand:+ start:418 stop:819 length:402 start_codon:yes stop_codon:yes gene_type:complete